MDQFHSEYEPIPFRDEAFPIRVLPDLRITSADPPEHITWHEQLEILYVLQGELVCRCDFRAVRCGAGEMVVINPCEGHAVSAEDSARYHCLMIDMRLCGGRDDISLQRYIEPVTERRARFHNLVRDERAAALVTSLLEEYRAAEEGYELAVKGNLLCLMAHLFRHDLVADNGQRKRGGHEAIAPALRHIAGHYAEEITLTGLAACCSMNRSYFCRLFRELTGRTAMAYLNEYRLAKAKAMLLTTSCSVSEAAAAVGFSDNGYFTRKFRELYGVTPTAMRREKPVPVSGGQI